MAGETLQCRDLVRMLHAAAEGVRAEKDLLTALDSHGGDGDHGTTMARAMQRLEDALEASGDDTVGALLKAVGWGIMGVDGGAIGPLLGTFFMAMAPVAPGDESDGATLAALFEAGLAGVEKRTRARVGDKTLVDALVPAVRALRAAADEDRTLEDALDRAARAAEQGAESTIELEARFGRAKNLGPESKGHADPGATSIALLFRGLHEGVRDDG